MHRDSPSPYTDWQALSTEQLEEAVARHNRLYWLDHAPEISDEDFDRLVETLRERAPQAPVLAAIGPAGAEGGDPAGPAGEKVAHDPPMLSLEKCYDEGALLRWFDRFEGPAVASPKIDGVALSLRYDAQGVLYLAATRGTGAVGEVATENARHIAGIPPVLQGRFAGPLEVRGEAFMPLSVFAARFQGAYASPRNIAAGALKVKDAPRTADYGLRFYAYDLLGAAFERETDKIAALGVLGFEAIAPAPLDREALQGEYERVAAGRLQADFEMDGVVFKAQSVAEQRRLGATAHHPRYAIAYKFQGDAGESVLRDVHWSVSRTGAINPVGIVDPVPLSGATVARVSLHNLAIMDRLGGDGGLAINSRVLMVRRGGVIPHMERVLEPGDVPVAIPEACPGCGAPTFREGDVLTARHRDACRSARLRQLAHFADALGIKGFGPKVLEQIYDAGLAAEPADLFTLTVADLQITARIGPKIAEKLVARTQACREVPAPAFLRALGIDELGKHVGQILADRYPDMDAVLEARAEDLAAIPTIGEAIARKVTAGLSQGRGAIARLLEHVRPQFAQVAEAPGDGPLSGKKFLFTGALSAMSRAQAEKEVARLGGLLPAGVTRDLDCLVLGDADMVRFRAGWRSGKLQKVEGLNAGGAGIRVLSESDFMAMVGLCT